jgi:hypothetical protein
MNYLLFDIECFIDYFLVMFMSKSGHRVGFEMYEGKPLDREGLLRVVESGIEIASFNGIGYDSPMLRYALAGASCAQLKKMSDLIIEGGEKHWDLEKKYNLMPINMNHVDLKEVAPGQASLKIYGGRLHCKRMQDLPYDPSANIYPGDRAVVFEYCGNDLETTNELRKALDKQLELRRTMMREMADELAAANVDHIFSAPDLRSKSDAQIAEAVLKHRVFLRTGAMPRKRPPATAGFYYQPPPHIQFRTKALQDVLFTISNAPMRMKTTGHVSMPESIKKLAITIGTTTYKMGLGGLHSQESEVSHYTTDEHYLRDIDVRSYYPQLMLNMRMYPDAMGPHFLVAYRDILIERLVAKDAGNKVKDASLKITLNGTFGKTSNMYSVLYNPRMMIATTLTGQLSILMLIEALEYAGIPVVSANTDGIVVKCPRKKEQLQRKIVKLWENAAQLETEETDYTSIHSRDVNSYVAIKTNGQIKTKGAFARAGLMKNPTNEICLDAVEAYLTKGTDPAEVIAACTDIRKFLTVRRVTGGAVKDDEDVGKAIRWYYSTEVKGVMRYATNDNAVPRTKGARACLELPDTLPADLDLDWYVRETKELLADIAVMSRAPRPKLPRRGTKAWKKLEALGLVETDEFDKPVWCCQYDEIPEVYRNAA